MQTLLLYVTLAGLFTEGYLSGNICKCFFSTGEVLCYLLLMLLSTVAVVE